MGELDKNRLKTVFREVSVDFVNFLIMKKGLPLKNYKGDKETLRKLFKEFTDIEEAKIKAKNKN